MKFSALLFAAVALDLPSKAVSTPVPGLVFEVVPDLSTSDGLRSALADHVRKAKLLAEDSIKNLKQLNTGRLHNLGLVENDVASWLLVGQLVREDPAHTRAQSTLQILDGIESTAAELFPKFTPRDEIAQFPDPNTMFSKELLEEWMSAVVASSFREVEEALKEDKLDVSLPYGRTYWNWARKVGVIHYLVMRLVDATTDEGSSVDGIDSNSLWVPGECEEGYDAVTSDSSRPRVDTARRYLDGSKLPTLSGHIELPNGAQYREYDFEVMEITKKLLERARRPRRVVEQTTA